MMLLFAALLLQSAMPSASVSIPPMSSDVVTTGRIELGMPVADPAGAPIGNVFAIDGDTVVVDTGSHRVAFSRSVFRMRSGGLVMDMSRIDVDSAAIQIERSVEASREPLLHAGVSVVGADGAPIGSVFQAEAGFLLVQLIPTGFLRLPDHAFAGAGDHLVMATTLARLKASIASR